jgi:hypothetical protein
MLDKYLYEDKHKRPAEVFKTLLFNIFFASILIFLLLMLVGY